MTAVAEALKTTVQWVDEDVAKVLIGPHEVAELAWVSETWTFFRLDTEGKVVHPVNEWINVDPDEHRQLSEERGKILIRPPEEHAPLIAEREGRVRMFRDDTRDLAVLGAKVKARKWWVMFEALLQGCTGAWNRKTGNIDHDGDTCPVHEL